MDWFVVAPFPSEKEDPWLGRFVPPGRHCFQSVPAPYEHDRSRKATSIRQWTDYFQHALRAKDVVRNHGSSAGIITNFPQLPLAFGCLQQLSKESIPTVAWSFNIGVLPEGLKKSVSRIALRRVDKFVVHSRAEIVACSNWLQVATERFEFVPLQRPVAAITVAEEKNAPFIISMGSAGRDYSLLFRVLEDLPYRAIVVAGKHAVAGLKIPANVELRSGLSIGECHGLLQQARLSVTPIGNTKTASGQVTLVDAMTFGKAQVVTRCPGSVDYVDHGKQALLVEPGDFHSLKDAVRCLWEQETMRYSFGVSGRERMIAEFSDEAGGRHLGRILDALEDKITFPTLDRHLTL
jgi:glycosyltransferase involved in cell wall biosynthesis